jgi:hypothetical protein
VSNVSPGQSAELRELEYQHRQEDRETRAAAENLWILAGKVKKARRAWEIEQNMWRGGHPTYTLASVEAKLGEYNALRSQLLEGCCNDQDLASQLLRQA